MFSEYMDIEKPIDDLVEEKDEGKSTTDKTNNFVDNNENGKDGKEQDRDEQLKMLKARNQINGWVRFLSNDDPNNLNQDNKNETLSSAFADAMEAGLGGITEKKIPGFHRMYPDGKEVVVESGEDSFSLSITKKDKDGKNENLHIRLSNFKNNRESGDGSGNTIDSMLSVSVDGNIKLLDKNLNDNGDILNIINSIENNIMGKERQDVHGIQDKNDREYREKIDNKQKSYELLLMELNHLMLEPPVDNAAIANRVMDSKNFDTKGQYLSARKTFLALCILLRGGNSIQQIKEKILGNKEVNVQKAVNTKNKESGENIVEYLTDNPLDLPFFIDNESGVVNLALQSNGLGLQEGEFLNLEGNEG